MLQGVLYQRDIFLPCQLVEMPQVFFVMQVPHQNLPGSPAQKDPGRLADPRLHQISVLDSEAGADIIDLRFGAPGKNSVLLPAVLQSKTASHSIDEGIGQIPAFQLPVEDGAMEIAGANDVGANIIDRIILD